MIVGNRFLFLSLFFKVFFLSAENYVDSLKQELNKTNLHDTARISVYLNLVENVFDDNEWPEYNEMAFKLANKIKSSSDEHIRRKALLTISDYYNNKGYLYKAKGLLQKALGFYLQSLKQSEEIEYHKGVVTACLNISTLLMQQKQYANARIYIDKGRNLALQLNDDNLYYLISQNLYALYYNQGKIEMSLKILTEFANKINETSNPNEVAQLNLNMGVLFKKLNNDTMAIRHFLSARNLFHKVNNPKWLADVYFNLAHLKKKENNTQKNIMQSMLYADSALYYAKYSNNIEAIVDIYDLQSFLKYSLAETPSVSLAEKVVLFKNALSDYKFHKQFKDSLLNIEVLENTTRQQIQFEFDKKEAILQEQQQNERAVNAEKEKYSRIILTGISIVFLIVLALLLIINKRYKQSRLQQKIILEQKKLVEDKQQEILDSIRYAKRIQDCMLPREHYLHKKIKQMRNNDGLKIK